MRRRRAIEIWPAFADLMTILAVPGLFLAMGLVAELGGDFSSFEDLKAENLRLQKERDDALGLDQESGEDHRGDSDKIQQALRERARNRAMFLAIQEVQRMIDSLAGQGELQFSSDQTLRFGDDLVTFDLNSTRADWKAGGREKLRLFCDALRRQTGGRYSELGAFTEMFSIEVEGHTDSTPCITDRNCNWLFSGARAVTFMTLMRDESICPGGGSLELKPAGYADTKPESVPGSSQARATRRIALRIVPNYQAIITAADLRSDLEVAKSQ